MPSILSSNISLKTQGPLGEPEFYLMVIDMTYPVTTLRNSYVRNKPFTVKAGTVAFTGEVGQGKEVVSFTPSEDMTIGWKQRFNPAIQVTYTAGRAYQAVAMLNDGKQKWYLFPMEHVTFVTDSEGHILERPTKVDFKWGSMRIDHDAKSFKPSQHKVEIQKRQDFKIECETTVSYVGRKGSMLTFAAERISVGKNAVPAKSTLTVPMTDEPFEIFHWKIKVAEASKDSISMTVLNDGINSCGYSL